MNDIVIVQAGPDKGLYLNGVLVPGVLRIVPDPCGPGDFPTAKIELTFRSYSFADEAPQK